MEPRLTILSLLGSLMLVSLSGCTTTPDSLSGILTEPATRTAASELELNAPAMDTQLASTGPSQATHTPSISASPEWTRPVAMTTPQSYTSTIDKARQDLAARLGLDLAAVQFIRISVDEFPADTLGCHGPDVTPRSIPAIVSGQVILLEARGVRYTYHARKEKVVFCGPWQ